MSKEELLSILQLLSALESWGFAEENRIPDYLHKRLSAAIELLRMEILK